MLILNFLKGELKGFCLLSSWTEDFLFLLKVTILLPLLLFFLFLFFEVFILYWSIVVKNPPANAGDVGDMGFIPGWERSPAGGNGNPLLCSCLENSMDSRTRWATVRGVTKSWHKWATEPVHWVYPVLSVVMVSGEQQSYTHCSVPLAWGNGYRKQPQLHIILTS